MRILVVDDSVVFRTAIKSVLLSHEEVKEVSIAAHGKIALDKIKNEQIDLITLDLEMPIMDGMETIQEVRKFDKDIPIILFSAQDLKAANKTLKALEMGANDFVQKIQTGSSMDENMQAIRAELVPRIEALVNRRRRRQMALQPDASPAPQVAPRPVNRQVDFHLQHPNLLCIGSSTGGPDVLKKVFQGLKKLRVPILLVQHMPPLFTTQLANYLNDIGPNTVVEAEAGMKLEPGTCYVAPGDYHMSITKRDGEYYITLDQNEKVCYVRPAVDVMMQSVSQHFSGQVLSAVFTGMGSDGGDGCKELKKTSPHNIVLIQDEESCVVWGMPKAVYENNDYDGIYDPKKITELINTMVG